VIKIPDDLAQQIQELAKQAKQTPEAFLEMLLSNYQMAQSQNTMLQHPELQAALQEQRQKAYARARQYWRETGNAERIALTDTELDAKFWMIDRDGIPRLKADQADITANENPLLQMAMRAEQYRDMGQRPPAEAGGLRETVSPG